MKTPEELLTILKSHEDYQTLVTCGVIPLHLRWEPQINRTEEYSEEDGKSVLVVTLTGQNYPGGPDTLRTSRTMRYAELLTEQEAKEQFPDEPWYQDQKNQWESQILTSIVDQITNKEGQV